MPADRSTLRQGVRALNLLDDMNNWGLSKRLLAETDMFAIDHTSELYAHMNLNYVRMNELPGFDDYGRMLEAYRAVITSSPWARYCSRRWMCRQNLLPPLVRRRTCSGLFRWRLPR